MKIEIKTNIIEARRYYNLVITEEQVVEIKRRISIAEQNDEDRISNNMDLWLYLCDEFWREIAIADFDFEEEYPDDDDELINLFK